MAIDHVVTVKFCHGDCGNAETIRMLGDIKKMLEKIMSEQSQLDADVLALGGVLSTIQTAEQANTTAVSAVQAEIAALQAQIAAGQPVDLSGLEALINGSADGTTPGLVQAAQSVTDGVAAVQGLVPAAPPAG